jgi:hypothetical protein
VPGSFPAGAATVEVGTETRQVRAVLTTGEERDALFARQAEMYPRFGEYAERTTRVIPVVALVPAG